MPLGPQKPHMNTDKQERMVLYLSLAAFPRQQHISRSPDSTPHVCSCGARVVGCGYSTGFQPLPLTYVTSDHPQGFYIQVVFPYF